MGNWGYKQKCEHLVAHMEKRNGRHVFICDHCGEETI